MRNYCYDCKYLSITEKEQDLSFMKGNGKPPHICNRYNKQILHKGHHPNLLKLKECNFKNDLPHRNKQ